MKAEDQLTAEVLQNALLLAAKYEQQRDALLAAAKEVHNILGDDHRGRECLFDKSGGEPPGCLACWSQDLLGIAIAAAEGK